MAHRRAKGRSRARRGLAAAAVALLLGAAAPPGAWRHDVDRSVFRDQGARP